MADPKNLDNVKDDSSDDIGSSSISPEAPPSFEKQKSLEKEKTAEIPASPKVPVPKSREEEKEKIDLREVDVSDSEGKVVDKRTRVKNTVPVDTRDELTKHADEEETKFIEGVNAGHGSDES